MKRLQSHTTKFTKTKRSQYIGAKVTPMQKNEIVHKANLCGMTVSDFLLALALDYEPKRLLTARQEEKLLEIDSIRAHLQNFSNALQGKSNKSKLELFGNDKFMHESLNDILYCIDGIKSVIDIFTSPNNFNLNK